MHSEFEKIFVFDPRMYLKWIAIWTHTIFTVCSNLDPRALLRMTARKGESFRTQSQNRKPWGRECVWSVNEEERIYKSRWPGYIRPIRCSSLTLYLGKKCSYGLFPPRLFGWISSKYYLDNTDRKEIKDKEWIKEQWYNEIVSIF